MSAKIKAYVSRYVVPFYYDTESEGFNRLIRFFDNNGARSDSLALPKDGLWVRAGFWENYKSDNPACAEMDLYSYLPSIYQNDEAHLEEDICSIGASYVYRTNGNLFEAEYRHNDTKIVFRCTDLGVLVFKDGTGFIWYEIDSGKGLDIDEYVDFQHDFKELARTHSTLFARKTGYDKENRQPTYETFCIGKWLFDLLSVRETGIRFWAERVSTSGTGTYNYPDKSLLFNYVYTEPIENETRDGYIFDIANGYDMLYSPPKDINDAIYKPFGNVNFYLTKAGMSCMISSEDTNEAFFTGQFREKYIRDYFFIYILLLYQSFSCAHYSRLLTDLPAEENMFEKNRRYRGLLESLNERINLFLVKSVFESVSNIHHQNDFYRYGKKVLCINEDIQSLTIGLDALKEIEGDKRERKVNNALAVFGFMVVISALVDGVVFVDWLTERIRPELAGYVNFGHVSIVLLVLVLALYLVIVLFKGKE